MAISKIGQRFGTASIQQLIPGMALGFFILGPRTRMSGQIGVPSIFCGSQHLGDPAPSSPQEIVGVVVMRKSDW